jgi:hypothetical protein
MKDEDFERLMDAWADTEVGSSPEVRPTAEMYRMVQNRQRRRPWFPAVSRPAIAAASAIAVVVVVVLLTVLLRPPVPPRVPPTQVVAYLGQREGYGGERGIVTTPPPPPGKGPKGEPVFFRRLWFQVQREGAQFVVSLDVLIPPEGMVTLTSMDNYRLLQEPSREAYVYVYQLSSDDLIALLFRNEAYSPVQNPLKAGVTHYLPAEPNWFYLAEGAGEERLYIVASSDPLPDLDDLYLQYSQGQGAPGQQEVLSNLLDRLDTLVESPSEAAAGWKFIFTHR